MMEHLNMQSMDKVAANVAKIRELFPNCVTERINNEGQLEHAIDFDMLKQELSDHVVDGLQERYQFTWPDKRKAILAANAPINKTLRPCREESVDFDNTENLYIEGDNLEVLKLLQETYLGKVKMIYIDPPYNTGNDFVYNDDFKQSSDEYVENSGQLDDEGNRLVANTERNGRFHTDWLNMIYPRLRLAKDLLDDNGVIFISIDQHELENLKKCCCDVFGEENLLSNLTIINNLKGRSDDNFFATCNEFLIVCAKNVHQLMIGGFKLSDEELEQDYSEEDSISAYKLIGLRKTGTGWERKHRPFMYYPVFYKDGKFSSLPKSELKKIYNEDTKMFDDDFVNEIIKIYKERGYKTYLPLTENGEFGRWRWGIDTFLENKDINLDVNSADTLCTKMRATLEDGSLRVKTSKTVWYRPEYDNGGASKLVKRLFNVTSDIFENPKSIYLLIDLLKIINHKDAIILDFFSGSATTAHAVMQLNAEDGGKRKFIMVQLPEVCAENSEAYKAGYKNICEIGKERIRRAGKKIKEENPLTTQDLDIGFRVLKCDSSNMEDVYFTPKEYMDKQQNLFVDNIKADRSDEDLLFDAMLKLDTPLSSKIEKITIAGKTVYNVAQGHLMACFDKNVTDEVITAIAKEMPSYFVMRDSSQADDSVAINFEQIFNTYSPQTVRRVL